MRSKVSLLACVWLSLANADELTRQLAARLPEEASAFARDAVKMVGEETIRQRLILELIANPVGPPKAKIQERTVISQYSFVSFRESPEALRELREVQSIDGKASKSRSLDSVAAAVTANDDKQKRKVLEDFEKLGLKGVASELGQLLLLFNGRKIQNYDFSLQTKRYVGADLIQVFSYAQVEGAGSMSVYRNKDVVRPKLSGEVWVDADYRPLKVTLSTVVEMEDKTGQVRHEMEVFYAPTAAGGLLPTHARYSEIRNGLRQSETEYEYRNFRPWDELKK